MRDFMSGRQLNPGDCPSAKDYPCPHTREELCFLLFCKFLSWEGWGKQVVKDLETLEAAIKQLEYHVYDEMEPDTQKTLTRTTDPSPETGPPPPPPFGE